MLLCTVLTPFSSKNAAEAQQGQYGQSRQSEQVQFQSYSFKPRAKKETNEEPSRAHTPSTAAKAAAIIDVRSGRILHSENGDEQLPMASTTKIMTAIVAIEHGKLSDKVKVSNRAVGKEGSSIYLRLGEEMSLNHMLYGLMLRSGNDAATAIAEHVGGSEEGFVYLMNEKARLLGLERTQFQNAHGLDAKGHYTTANELARISAYALHNATFREMVRTRIKSAPNPYEKWDYKWVNKNKMLRFYEGADGVKTGYTKQALRCLVSSATRNGQQLAVVTLNDGQDWVDHEHLLDYGFKTFPLTTLIEAGQKISGYPLIAKQALKYPLTLEEKEQVTSRLTLTPKDTVDYRLGDRGRLEFRIQDQVLGAVSLRDDTSPNG
ncbi:D-alanyl-D-alanine carboxypeptidase [Paenibacillus sp. 481]|nr:D-alanyl-D-alanine carboxypeptidase [Paenibacillus sp. 481]